MRNTSLLTGLGLAPGTVRAVLLDRLTRSLGRGPESATQRDIYDALSLAVREELAARWLSTQRRITYKDLECLFAGLPVRYLQRTVIFGAYDNVIARWPAAGGTLRKTLQGLEKTPARIFGLSHFWVVEKSD